LNSSPVEMTVDTPTSIWETFALSDDPSGANFSTLCGYATHTWSNLPEFCNSDNQLSQTNSYGYECTPTKVAHLNTHTVNVDRAHGYSPDTATITINVSLNCAS
jgi:hypothetical protein